MINSIKVTVSRNQNQAMLNRRCCNPKIVIGEPQIFNSYTTALTFILWGKLVKNFKTNNITFSTDVNVLENGIYTIRFNFNGEIINKRFIVQK